jgi:hypothetical protein
VERASQPAERAQLALARDERRLQPGSYGSIPGRHIG